MWLAVFLALVAALAYVLIVLDILGVGDLEMAADGDVIVYVAAGSYVFSRWGSDQNPATAARSGSDLPDCHRLDSLAL
jgi:hypothetical protein